MRKLNLLLIASLTTLPLLLSGCKGNSTYPESQATMGSTESETFYVTAGIYVSSEDLEGYKQAKFINEYGQEFLANITDDTETPEIFEEGKTYEIVHTDILTASIPGIYPEVSKIKLAEYDLDIMETTQETSDLQSSSETTPDKNDIQSSEVKENISE